MGWYQRRVHGTQIEKTKFSMSIKFFFVFVLFIASALSKSVFKHEAIGDITSTHAEKTANGIAVKASAAGDKTPLLRIRKMLELQPQRWQARQIPRLRMHQPQFRIQMGTNRSQMRISVSLRE